MLQRPSHTLAPNELHVWHLLADGCCAEPMSDILSPEERTRQRAFRKDRDRDLYTLARGLMRRVLASYLDCPAQAIRFKSNSFGKPILDGIAGLHFNLSHSHGAIALAVSANREVGIDVEDRFRAVEYQALAERFFAGDEARHLCTLDDEQRREAFFAIWTLKEAFVKAIGRGLSFPLDAFCFELDCDRFVGFRPLAASVLPEWHFHQFDLGDRHRGAVAAHNPRGDAMLIQMRDASVFV